MTKKPEQPVEFGEPVKVERSEFIEAHRHASERAERGELGLKEAARYGVGELVCDVSGQMPRGIALKVQEIDAAGNRLFVNGGDKYGTRWLLATDVRNISDISFDAANRLYNKEKGELDEIRKQEKNPN